MELLLKNISWVEAYKEVTSDIRIHGNRIAAIGDLQPGKNDITYDFADHFIYPGLINAHDHLELNLYPRLGSPFYSNYVQWSNDIYRPSESPVREIEKIDINDRLLWGGIKNLISGVATVVHHNPWYKAFEKTTYPVKVLKGISWSHSLVFGKNVKKEFSQSKDRPFIIHAGEGVDELAANEIDKLDELNVLDQNTVLIHCVAVDDIAIGKLKKNGVAVVWCPASNNFMFGKTAPIEKMKGIRLALGTDSTLTGSPTLLEEMQAALKSGYVDAREIFNLVTDYPANIFNLQAPFIALQKTADFFITRKKAEDYFENLVGATASDIEMAVLNGDIRLQSTSIDSIPKILKHRFQLNNRSTATDLDIASLKARIGKIALKRDLERNALWNLIQV